MAATLEEVRKLAEDFQAVQRESSKQKLSERNVIQIVSKLVELHLLDVIYTIDGKEYLTHQELAKEIREELDVHGGRINLVDLQSALNVDFSHVETKANEMVQSDRNLVLVLGQLVSKGYLDRLAEEVNDNLQEKGHVTMGELIKNYDLPPDFLSTEVHKRVGTIIQGKVDSYDKDVIFTDAFVTRLRAQIRGAFSAVTKPVLLGTVIQRYRFQERMFFSILEELISSKRLAGSISGGRQEKSTYIPNIFTKSQNDWVDSFYRQNGYLEYDALLRLGITDPTGFIKKRYKSEQLVYLSTCCAGRTVLEQMEASVDEALEDGAWVDVLPLLPSVFSVSDANQVLCDYLKKKKGVILCCDTIVASDKLITQCSKPFPDLMAIKAEKDAKSHPALKGPAGDGKGAARLVGVEDGGQGKEDKKEQRRKKAAAGSGSTKSGGGTQGREIKTKSTKKKYNKGRDHDDSDDENMTPVAKGKQQDIPFMSVEEIEEVLRKDKILEDCPDEFVTEIAQQLHRPLTKQYQEIAKSVFLQSTGAATTSARKKIHGELQEKITGLWTNARLFEKGLKLLPDDTQQHLVRHLLRTVCTDITNIVLNAVATDHMMSVSDDLQLTTEGRAKIISKLPAEVQGTMTKIHTSLTGKSLDDFFNYLDVICDASQLGILFKKPDKKKERQLIFNHRQALCEQLNQESDPAMSLHLAAVILFQTFTQSIVHVPGKCVPQLIQFLKGHLEHEKFNELTALQACLILLKELEHDSQRSVSDIVTSLRHQLQEGMYNIDRLQDLVVAQMKTQGEGEQEADPDMTSKISDLVSKVKDIALTTKKSSQQGASED